MERIVENVKVEGKGVKDSR